MIYISTAALKNTDGLAAIYQFVKNGFKNIELTGGFSHSVDLKKQLIELKKEYGLNYLCHNYFPPPKKDFVLNLASLDDFIYRSTMEHFKLAIDWAKEIGDAKFGIHAGFYADIDIDELGCKIGCQGIKDIRKSLRRFCDGYAILKKYADGVNLYIENNVISAENLKICNGINPFMMVNLEEYLQLKKLIDFELLLDVGHLKVSATSLGLNFYSELERLAGHSNYIHISDNDGSGDLHCALSKNSDFLSILGRSCLAEKAVVLETRADMGEIKMSYTLIQEAING